MAQTTKEQLLAYLAEAQGDAAKADEQIERQRALIDELQAGWIDFDPTGGTTGAASLVTVAVVPDPYHALPLHGTYFGGTSDHLGMDVRVSVITSAPDVTSTMEAR